MVSGIAEKLGECGVETDNDKTAEQVYTDIDFGPEDNLSRLPDLCLFQILLLLSRNDLDNLKKVSRKMGAIVEEPELRKIKSGGGHLCIFRLPRGHGFELEMGKIKLAENDDREVNSDVVFVYEAEFVKGKGYKHGITERRTTTTISRVEARLHRSPCPKSMFDILEKLLNTRTVDVVRLHSVGLDASLLEGLVSSTMGQSLKELHVLNCKVNATHEDFEKFTNWIKTTRTKKLTVKNTCGLVRSSFLNENFFIEMNGQMTSIDIEASFVQYSTRLRSAIASYDAGSWRICTNRLLTVEEVKAQFKDPEFEYEFKRGCHYIAKRSNKLVSKFGIHRVHGLDPVMIMVVVESWSREFRNEERDGSPRPRHKIKYNRPMN